MTDLTGIDPDSISLSVASLGAFTVTHDEVEFSDDVIVFLAGDDTPLGIYGATVDVSLVVADMRGNATTNDWRFELEISR